MGCCETFCKVNNFFDIFIQDQIEENLSQDRLINHINNNNLSNGSLQPPSQNQNRENLLNNNNISNKILKNSSEYTFKNNFNQNNNNNNEANNNYMNGENINDINNYLSNNENNENLNNHINNDMNINNNINNNNNINENSAIPLKDIKEEEKKNRIMDRINKGRKQIQNKNEVNNYKKSEKIQNFANELEKVMFGQKAA